MTGTLLRSSTDLPALKAELSTTNGLSALEEYLRRREQGRRRDIAHPLAAFAAAASGWPFPDRRALVRWIGEPWIAAAGYAPTRIFPKRGDPVFAAVVPPTLEEWQRREPSNPEPRLLACLWDEPDASLGDRRTGGLRELVAAFPALAPARRVLVRAIVDGVVFAQHELPHGYLGSPAADLLDLAAVERDLAQLPDDDWRQSMTRMVSELVEVARRAEAGR